MHCLLSVVSILINFGYMHVCDWASHVFLSMIPCKGCSLAKIQHTPLFQNAAILPGCGCPGLIQRPSVFQDSWSYVLHLPTAHCPSSRWQPRCTRTLRQPILSQWQEEARLQELYARAPSTVVPKLRPWMEVCGSRARRRGK
jgi:hypothetical protein